MNKKIIALAVAAALAPVAAMADSGNVTIYGQANVSYDLVKIGGVNGANNESVNRVSDNASRLGFKGTEDLGNGLSAVWQMEAAINLDDSTANSMTNRNSFAGLSSKTMGTVILGRHDTPYKLATRGLDQFGDTLGDARSLMGGGVGAAVAVAQSGLGTISGAQSAVVNFDGRQSNVVAYISPTFSGFHGAIAHVDASEQATAGQTKSNAWSAAGIYDNGPLFGSLAYEVHNLGNTAGLVTDMTEKAWKVGVGYKMAGFDVGAAYEKISDDRDASVGANNAHKAYQLGAGYTFGSNKVKLQYVKADKTDRSSNLGQDNGAKMWAIGFDHNMSKRTRLYALYTKLDNATDGTYNLSNGGNGTAGFVGTNTADSNPSAWSFGMKHSF